MRNKGIASLAAAFVAISMASCNTNGCLENRNSVPLAGFYDKATQEKVALDSVEVRGVGMPDDDPLSAAGNRISSIYLPMRAAENSTSWVFSYKWKDLDFAALNDTIAFEYDSTPYFASSDCGVIYKYKITRMACTSHLIDSVALVDSLITNVDIEQIKIYFRSNEQEEPENPEETQQPDPDSEE